jgi:hypothetical protein
MVQRTKATQIKWKKAGDCSIIPGNWASKHLPPQLNPSLQKYILDLTWLFVWDEMLLFHCINALQSSLFASRIFTKYKFCNFTEWVSLLSVAMCRNINRFLWPVGNFYNFDTVLYPKEYGISWKLHNLRSDDHNSSVSLRLISFLKHILL